MSNLKKLPNAIQFALFASAATLVTGNAIAQESTNDSKPTTLDRVEVTGSRLKRAQVEGATPVVVIDRASIDASGDISVADVLRDSTFASFGNFKPQSGSSAQSLATINLRGLGSGRTLVLIDGHRAATNPMSASSGTDLNTIPLAAVERIEILTDGASAIYGSDAIGGVVNIITRKDFNGAEIRFGHGDPKVKGGNLDDVSVAFGVSGDRGSLLGSASMMKRGMVFTRDQIGGNVIGSTIYGNNYYDWATQSTKAVPGFSCDQGAFYVTANGLCSFNFNTVAANEASVDNKALFLKGHYQINDDWSTYMTVSSTQVKTFGRYAPVPGFFAVDDGTPSDVVKGDGLPTYFYHRFAAAGNRDNTTNATNNDFLFGFQGQLSDSVSVDFGVRFTDYQYKETGNGYIISSLATQAANDGDYLLTDPYGASEETIKGFTATIGRDSHYKSKQFFGSVNFDLFEMGGGMSNAVVGAEYYDDDFADVYDSLSQAGVVLGSSGGSSGGSRNQYAAYFEWLLPFTSNFDVNIAGRYDKYSDYGSDFSPKVSLRYQPLDNLTFRASYGEGFRAPGLDILTQAPSYSAESVYDPRTCLAQGLTATCTYPGTSTQNLPQVDTTFIANPNLSSEQSKQYQLGVVYDPLDWLDVSLDYYKIKIEDSISQFSAQDVVDHDLYPETYGAIPAGFSITRNASGRITHVVAGYANQGDVTTDGFDFRLNTKFDMGAWGTLSNRLTWSYINEYEVVDVNGVKTEYTGRVGSPQNRVSLQNAWTFGDWEFDWNVNAIGHQRDRGDLSTPDDDQYIGTYTTHDIQVSYHAPWNGTIALGATNVGDRYPELVAYDGRPWNFNLYDAYGRTVYFRYTQRF